MSIFDELLSLSKYFKFFTFILMCITIFSIQLNMIAINTVNDKISFKIIKEEGWQAFNPPTKDRFVLKINGCYIPKLRYVSTYARGSLSDCGTRQIFLRKISEKTAQFEFRARIKKCCYLYVTRSNKAFSEDTKVNYTHCSPCKNGTTFNVSGEVIKLKCKNYTDLYTFVIKKQIPENIQKTNGTPHWNVLIFGIDSYSRVRSLSDLRKTVTYIKRNGWLDFRGYNKIGDNSLPNLVPLITNISQEDFRQKCLKQNDTSICNHLFIWNRFRDSGYVSLFVEDAAFMNCFSVVYGMKIPPADHYIKPLFLEAEQSQSYLYSRPVTCAGKISEGEHILNYALDFVNTYKDSKFFGFFWMSTLSHGVTQSMKLLDQQFLDTIRYVSKISKNTFIFIVSDHGKRYGDAMMPIESYYDSRLPAFFLIVPKSFMAKHPQKFTALQTNQKRLVSTPDIHLTLNDILSISTSGKTSSNKYYYHHHCKKCKSLLKVISENRKCIDASIPEQFCTCHDIEEGWISKVHSQNVLLSAEKAFAYQINKTEFKKKNQYCLKMKMSKIIRVHRFIYESKLFYILGLQFSPTVYNEDTDFNFEIIAKVNDDQNITILSSYTLDPFRNTHAYCCVEQWQCIYCVCRTK